MVPSGGADERSEGKARLGTSGPNDLPQPTWRMDYKDLIWPVTPQRCEGMRSSRWFDAGLLIFSVAARGGTIRPSKSGQRQRQSS